MSIITVHRKLKVITRYYQVGIHFLLEGGIEKKYLGRGFGYSPLEAYHNVLERATEYFLHRELWVWGYSSFLNPITEIEEKGVFFAKTDYALVHLRVNEPYYVPVYKRMHPVKGYYVNNRYRARRLQKFIIALKEKREAKAAAAIEEAKRIKAEARTAAAKLKSEEKAAEIKRKAEEKEAKKEAKRIKSMYYLIEQKIDRVKEEEACSISLTGTSAEVARAYKACVKSWKESYLEVESGIMGDMPFSSTTEKGISKVVYICDPKQASFFIN